MGEQSDPHKNMRGSQTNLLNSDFASKVVNGTVSCMPKMTQICAKTVDI